VTNPIKAVIFDWAGTVIDFGCLAPVEALLDVFAAEGAPISAEQARRDMGRAKKDHVEAILRLPRVAEAWARTRHAASGPADVDRIFAALEPAMEARAAARSELIPGAADLARRLRSEGVRVGSGTGYTRAMMTRILPAAAAQGYAPDVVVCAGETPAGRPTPLMVWAALVSLAAWPAWACVKIDDAEVGIAEGANAGCWTIGVAASGNGVGLQLADFLALAEPERRARIETAADGLRAAGADFVADTVADAWPALEEIGRRVIAGERPRGWRQRAA
jgi:phosphonoacetaldehyde hydrolase